MVIQFLPCDVYQENVEVPSLWHVADVDSQNMFYSCQLNDRCLFAITKL